MSRSRARWRRRPTTATCASSSLTRFSTASAGHLFCQARQNAYDLLIDHARAVGANAIVGLRYDASEIGGKASSASEVLCYGTAVVIEPIK